MLVIMMYCYVCSSILWYIMLGDNEEAMMSR